MKEFIAKHRYSLFFLTALTGVSFWISTISPAPPQTNLVDLAYAFLHGRLDLIPPIRVWNDYAVFQGKYFIHFGPFAGVLYIPFVLIFGSNFPQQLIIPVISLIIFVSLYRITRHLGTSSSTALWLATFFIFGTIFLILTLTTISSYNAQIIGLLFLVLALLEFTQKRRPWLIGFLISLAGLTRITYYGALVFFLFEFLKSQKDKIRRIGSLLLLPGVSLIIWGMYNYLRFGNIFDTGYGYIPETYLPLIQARSYGLLSLKHVPGNLYLLLFKGPDPVYLDNLTYILKFPYLQASKWGMGIFFTSPVLVYLILTRLKERFVSSSLITISVLLILPSTFYGVGVWQYGYRYALDAYPFFLIILTSIFKEKMPFLAKLLIVYGIIFNLLFMYSIWGKYPF